MKPYFKIKRERYAEIWVGNLWLWTIVKHKAGKDVQATFNCPGGEYQKDEARAFVQACDMALNFAGIPKQGKGGRVKTEFNDKLQWFYFDEPSGKFVTHDGKFIKVASEQLLLAPEVRRYAKVVGTAGDFKFPKASKSKQKVLEVEPMTQIYIVDNTPKFDKSDDPMAWTRAGDAMRDVGLNDLAKICNDTAKDLFIDANENADPDVATVKK